MQILQKLYPIIINQKLHAIDSGLTLDSIESNHRLCAERRLIEKWSYIAKKHGITRCKQAHWIRRKFGSDIMIWRMLANGKLGVSIPCIYCCKEIVSLDLTVHCINLTGQQYHGKLSDINAPSSSLTGAQRRIFKQKKK